MTTFADGSYGSQAGIALIAKVLAGKCKMKYTRASVGKGQIPEGKTPKTMTEAADFVLDAKIASVSNPANGECQVTVQIKSDQVQEGFYATNIVLFAEDPDLGEVPYTYLFLENEPEWIRPSSSNIGKLTTFDIIAAVGDITTVSASIDSESVATIGEIKRRIVDNCTTEESDKMLSARQGSVLQSQIERMGNVREITLPPSAWRGDSAPFTQEISIDGVSEADMVMASAHIPKGADSAVKKAAECIDGIETGNGYVRFYCNKKKPSGDVVVLIRGV